MTHRVRLTGMLTASVAVALAVVFLIVFGLVRGQSLSRRYSELEQSVGRIAHEWTGPASLAEEHEDFPDVDFTVSKPDGTVLAMTGKKPTPFSLGSKKQDNHLYFGLKSDTINVIGTASWAETEAGLKLLAVVLAVLWFPLVLLTLVVAWYGGGLVLRPVTELVRSADKLSSLSNTDLLETSDNAEFASLASALNELISRVRKAAEVQEQFAADAAHELRSPLALLRTRVETTLLSDRDPHQYKEALGSMLNQIERLTSIVETLLASARDLTPQASSISLDVVREIATQWSLDVGWEPSRLDIQLQPCTAKISIEELRIILTNILSNAARFSPEGAPIMIRVDQQEDRVRLSFRDFGPGLSDEARSRAFDRFYRSDENRNREHGGTGIGLAVVRRIVESRGGKIGFDEVETGALVSILLPQS